MSDSIKSPEDGPPVVPPNRRGVIHSLVAAPLSQPLLVALLVVALIATGIFSLKRLPVDAYPDVSPPRVELVTPWPGRAARRSNV